MDATLENSPTIFASQTMVNGSTADYRFSIGRGSVWRYLEKGASWRDGTGDFILVNGRPQRTDTHAVDSKPFPRMSSDEQDFELIYDYSFEVSDGEKSYTISVNEPEPAQLNDEAIIVGDKLLTFVGEAPPPRRDLTVVNPVVRNSKANVNQDPRAKFICFTPGTWIRTPTGPRLVEQLAVGDPVLTKDSGVQTIRWIGNRRMTGARFVVMPEMRPVRIRRGALGGDVPNRDIWVSPKHRMVLKGPQADLLFNTPEILVAAKDMINGRSVLVDHQVKQTNYIHLLFDDHQIIWANGAETESFHPGYAMLNAVARDQLDKLFQIFPELSDDPHRYGDTARRSLQPHEAAVLLHETGMNGINQTT